MAVRQQLHYERSMSVSSLTSPPDLLHRAAWRGLMPPAQSAQRQCLICLTCREITAFHFSYESICITACFQMHCLAVNNKH